MGGKISAMIHADCNGRKISAMLGADCNGSGGVDTHTRDIEDGDTDRLNDEDSAADPAKASETDDLHQIVKTGNVDALKKLGDEKILCSWLSPAKNTFLHVAAKHGKEEMVKFITAIHEDKSLVSARNRRGDTALHVAAKAGHLTTVSALVQVDKHCLLQAKNDYGNTPLHEALLFSSKDDDSVAKYLIEQDPHQLLEFSAMNSAVKAGFKSCISLVPTDHPQRLHEQLFTKKSMAIIKEAIQKKDDTGVLEAIFSVSANFTDQFKDDEGRNPLHYAASLGYHRMAKRLLELCAVYAIQQDQNGSLPIHLACSEGHVKVVKLLLDNTSDPEERFDKKWRSILHVAAEKGRDNVVKILVNNKNFDQDFINMRDNDGNTAFHLASQSWEPMVVSTLTWDKRVNIKIQNKEDKTALDLAETTMNRPTNNMQWLTIIALRTAGATRTLESVTAQKEEETATNNEIYKEKVNYRLLIAILIATVAFEAGFRLPYERESFQSKANSSLENMFRRKAFTAYVFSNTIAMYSSVAAAVVLSWAQSGDLTLVINALNFTLPLFWLALSMMSMAFTTGVYLVINHHTWLSIASLAMGVFFHMFLLFNSLVLFSPIVSSNKYLRYLCYYPFRFLVLMNSGWLTNTSRLRYFVWSTQH